MDVGRQFGEEPQQSLDRPNLSDIASDHIKKLIFEGSLPPGEKIVEDDIARQLGTSRTPIKLALTELAKDGLVDLVPRRGAFVRTIAHTDIIELYEIRRVFEGLAGRLAARHAEEGDLAALESANREYADPVAELSQTDSVEPEGVRKTKELDMRFHLRVLDATGNRNLTRLGGLEVIELLSFLYGNPINPVATGMRTNEEHVRIIASIRDRDEERAERLAREHITHAIDILEGRTAE